MFFFFPFLSEWLTNLNWSRNLNPNGKLEGSYIPFAMVSSSCPCCFTAGKTTEEEEKEEEAAED
jgi:hypothetical protein